MNYLVAEALKNKLTKGIYIDRLAGLVREVTESKSVGEGRTVEKTYPVACGLDNNYSDETTLKNLVPDAKFKSILYFEDNGIVFSSKDAHGINFISTLQLVGWINLKKFKQGTCSLSGLIAADIIGKLTAGPFNSDPLTKVTVSKINEVAKDKSIFMKYSYNANTSYLIYPYDYFALSIETKFTVRQNCLDGIELEENDC